jgi:hypothetical protein
MLFVPIGSAAGVVRRSLLEPGGAVGRSQRSVSMDVVSIAAKKRQTIEQYEVHVRGSQRDEYPQVFTEIEVTHAFVGRDLSEAALRRSIELSATKYCPVSAMISAGATIVHHRYQIWSLGDAPYDSQGEVITTGPHARPDILADQQ